MLNWQNITCLLISQSYVTVRGVSNSFLEGIRFVELKLRIFIIEAAIFFSCSLTRRRICQFYQIATFVGKKGKMEDVLLLYLKQFFQFLRNYARMHSANYA